MIRDRSARRDGPGRPGADAPEVRIAVAGLLRCAAAWLVLVASPASAVLLSAGDGTGNTTPPADDPGVAILGTLNGLGALYLGNGWVLTAWHVGDGAVTFGGVDHPPVPGSRTRLTGPGPGLPDVAVMKIAGDPGIAPPILATSTIPVGTDVVIVGNGKDRGTALTWMSIDGWNWGTPFTTRWGTNRVTVSSVDWLDTRSFEMRFDEVGHPAETADEAHATLGDSGGAAFWKDGGQWKLAGMLFLAVTYQNQPAKTALFGNLTVAADVAYYRTQIVALTSAPACSDGLDDDLDGLVDHPADPGCDGPTDTSEWSSALECDDGIDNDGDGFIDHTADPECTSPTAPSEAPSVPAAAPWSLTLLVTGLSALGLRGARRAPLSRAAAPGSCRGSRRSRCR